jgi:hypothetical protein
VTRLGLRRSSFSADGWASLNEKPDRYAAAICIRVRPECFLFGYSFGEGCSSLSCEGRNRHQALSASCEISSIDYFFFFLAVFFDFFAFFAFLAMLPSVAPRVESMQVDDRHACIQNTPQLQN